MKKTLFIFSLFTLLLSAGISKADTAGAKQALAQNTTNSYCSTGYNGQNPFEDIEKFKKDQFKNGCPAGMSYVECLRKSWSEKK